MPPTWASVSHCVEYCRVRMTRSSLATSMNSGLIVLVWKLNRQPFSSPVGDSTGGSRRGLSTLPPGKSSGRLRQNESASFTSAMPSSTFLGVMRFSRPSGSSSPQSPQVEPSGRCFQRFISLSLLPAARLHCALPLRHHARMAPRRNSANRGPVDRLSCRPNEVLMSAATVPLNRDIRVISLIGVAHGVSHYYQLAFATMLLIVRQEAGLSFTDVGLLMAIFYGVSGAAQTAAGFAVDRFGARPILAGVLAVIGCALALISVAHSFAGFAAIAVIGGLGNAVFHPAEFALLNASVNHGRPGRAYSIHGVGGSLGWAAAPVMFFLDSMFGWVGAALIGALPGLILSVLVLIHRTELVDHRVKARPAATQHGPTAMIGLFLQPAILLCLVYFALLSATTGGIQQFAVPAWASMFGVREHHEALSLIVFIVGSAGGVLVGGFF